MCLNIARIILVFERQTLGFSMVYGLSQGWFNQSYCFIKKVKFLSKSGIKRLRYLEWLIWDQYSSEVTCMRTIHSMTNFRVWRNPLNGLVDIFILTIWSIKIFICSSCKTYLFNHRPYRHNGLWFNPSSNKTDLLLKTMMRK